MTKHIAPSFSIGSDHRVVTADLKLSLRTTKTAYNWKVSRGDGDLQQLYTVKVLNRYDQLCDNSESGITETYKNLIQANSEAAKELIPPKTRSKRKLMSSNPNVIAARTKVNNAFSNYEQDPTSKKEKMLQDEKTNLKNVYDQAYEEELDRMIAKVELADARAKHAESWKLVNEICGRKAPKKAIIKGCSSKDRVDFSDLLGKVSENLFLWSTQAM